MRKLCAEGKSIEEKDYNMMFEMLLFRRELPVNLAHL
jgi:hypothetical protein